MTESKIYDSSVDRHAAILDLTFQSHTSTVKSAFAWHRQGMNERYA